MGPGVTVAERAAWAERGAGAERVEGGRPRAWAELARAAAALRPGCSERCCWARRSLAAGLGRGKEKERPAGKEGWVGFSHGLGCFGFGLALGFGLLFYF